VNDNGITYLPNSKPCFICGEDNPAGVQTRFYVENGIVKAPFMGRSHHCGFENVVHGGVVAAILDECMGWSVARVIHRMCLTGELTVRYLKPVLANRPMTACSEVVKASRRMGIARGWLIDEEGTQYARAQGRFVPLSVEATLEVDDNLLYHGDEERVFDGLREASPRP
jgi:uncharacterized protein (TIGR00369 family)